MAATAKARFWNAVGTRFLPFADAASEDLPLSRLMRLSLFQITCGMALVLLTGTLNRVMIVELGVPTTLVATMIALPVVIAPFRALMGHRSDHHRSALGWRRTPYIWFGTLMQFGGLAIMPFSLIVLSGDTTGEWNPLIGQAAAAVAFLLTGAGLHTTQTAGLALATDLADDESRPRVVALLYVMLLVGMAGSAAVFGWLLTDFSQLLLIQVVQGAAAVTFVLNLIALWKQEALKPQSREERARPRPLLRDAWKDLASGGRTGRLLLAVALGTGAFTMQDVLLEPYGGQIFDLSVSQTTALTALWAIGSLIGFALAARGLSRSMDACRIAAWGAVIGLFAFAAVIFAAPMDSPMVFRAGAMLIGLGGGLFAVGTLTAAMALGRGSDASGLALGAWGAAQATAAGLGIAAGGVIRDAVSALAETGSLGPALTGPATGYATVYLIEIGLLFATLAAIGPLATRRDTRGTADSGRDKIGLAEFPA